MGANRDRSGGVLLRVREWNSQRDVYGVMEGGEQMSQGGIWNEGVVGGRKTNYLAGGSLDKVVLV